MAIAEALASGTPVVASPDSAKTELVNQSNGVLTHESHRDEPSRFAEGLLTLLDTHLDRGLIAQDARDRYSFEAVGKRLNAMYERILDRTER